MSSFRPQKSLMSTFRFSSYLPYYVFEVRGARCEVREPGSWVTKTGLVGDENTAHLLREI